MNYNTTDYSSLAPPTPPPLNDMKSSQSPRLNTSTIGMHFLGKSSLRPSPSTPSFMRRAQSPSQQQYHRRRRLSVSSASSESSTQSSTASALFSHIDPASNLTVSTIHECASVISCSSSTSILDSECCWPSTSTTKAAATATSPASASSSSSLPLSPSSASLSTSSSPAPPSSLMTAADILAELQNNPNETRSILEHALQATTFPKQHRCEFYQAVSHWSQTTHNVCATVWMARCLLDGWGVAANPIQGLSMLETLATRCETQAYLPLAEYYRRHCARKDAIRWYKHAVDDASTETEIVALAQFRLGELFAQSNQEGSLAWFEKSAQNGNRYGQYITGIHYQHGMDGATKNLELAKHYFLMSAEQDYAEAQAALGILLVSQNHHDQGKQWLDRAATKQHGRALLQLGSMYENGHGVLSDATQAMAYYTKAATEGDHPVAQYLVGLHYRFGTLGVPKDYAQASQFLSRSANAGYAPAQRVLGLMLAQGLTCSTTTSSSSCEIEDEDNRQRAALAWFRRAASQGDVRSLCLVGTCYERGTGVSTDYDKAYEYYHRAARINGPFQAAAQYVTGQLLLLRMHRQRDAYEWFKRASSSSSNAAAAAAADNESEDPAQVAIKKARVMVARFHLHGWAHVPKDMKLAFDLLQQSLPQPSAHYWLGACYEEGIPTVCNPDPIRAFHHYQKAAEGGETDGEFQVALMLANGQGVPNRDRRAAFPWYEKAAAKGHRIALYSLGLYYAKGLEGVSKPDAYRARQCFERAARKGYVPAMTSLAILCRAMQNHESMLHWYHEAAGLGDAVAQRDLGMLHAAGLGVPQDYAIAFKWLYKAAEQKEPKATLLLASYYQNGWAVPVDLEKALTLYQQAGQLGATTAWYAMALLYQSIGNYDQAFLNYKRASNDQQLAMTTAGKNAKLMLARYILGYYLVDNAPVSITDMDGLTATNGFQILFDLANSGEFPSAYFWLGMCYHQGNGVKEDQQEAFEWFFLAADKAKTSDAMMRVGMMYEEGLGVEKDELSAFEYYLKCAEQDHPEGQYKVGLAYWRGLFHVEMNLGEAVVWFTRSASSSSGCCPLSIWALGQMAFENGDRDVAVAWWRKSIRLGHVPSMRALAGLLLEQPTDKTNAITTDMEENEDEEAIGLLTSAVESGDADALVMLGRYHEERVKLLLQQQHQRMLQDAFIDEEQAEQLLEKIDRERNASIRCFEQAASMGHVEAMFLAAQSWHSQQQFAAALEFYTMAAKHGHMLSKVMCARYRIAGHGGLQPDPEKAYKELLICAEEHQCVDAFNTLAQCHELGIGTAQDDRFALQWYLRSAEATQDAEAMFRIGRMHAQGRVLAKQLDNEQDDGHHPDFEAFQWFQFACEAKNHPRAHYHLGLYHLHGIVLESTSSTPRILVPVDHVLACHHLEQAAVQDDCDAMVELGQLLMSSEEPTHANAGLAWLERAAQLGSTIAQCELGKLYHTGTSNATTTIEQNHEKAYDYFCRAAQQDNEPTAILFLGSYYEHGIHVAANVEEARRCYTWALEQQPGWWLAELALAKLLHANSQSQSEAYALFQAAHEHAPPHAQTSATLMVALYELYGWAGVPANPTQAAATLIELAESGEPRAFFHVAQCYDQGRGVQADRGKAFDWYMRAVEAHLQHDDDLQDDYQEQEIADAAFRLAEFYQHGWGVPVDQHRANELYCIAAEHGNKKLLN